MRFRTSLLLAASTIVTGCAFDEPCTDEACTSAAGESTTAGGMPVLPAPGGTGELTPWGGTNAARWRPEAIIANATSLALNAAWSRTDISEAIVAVPAKMLESNFFQFGDGQANVAPSFEGWHESRPPVVATLIRLKTGGQKLLLRGDHALPNSDTTWDARYTVGGQTTTVSLPISRDASFPAQWDPKLGIHVT